MSIRISSDALRLSAALCLCEILAGEESAETIQQRIDARGLVHAVDDLNDRWETRLSAGPYVLYSQARNRYWSEDHGWVVDEEAANGYAERDLRTLKAHKVCGAPDAEFRPFAARELLAA
jgi:hypothetical protein